MMSRIFILAATMVAGLTAITIGCGGGDTSSGNTPSETVDKLYQLAQEENCQEIADLVIDTNPQLADRYISECELTAGNLVSYSIKSEEIDETGLAYVETEVEVTIEENGEKGTRTYYGSVSLVKQDDEWKLTEITPNPE